jgi:hypothetical protein
MNYEFYAFTFDAEHQVFEFESIGPFGSIRKRVQFETTELPGFYNLVFGDLTKNNKIDDYSISNNGDRNKILATVARMIEQYTILYPERCIYIKGSTIERTRLYRMAIGNNLAELSEKYEIYGETDRNDFSQFFKDMNVIAFVIKRKIT